MGNRRGERYEQVRYEFKCLKTLCSKLNAIERKSQDFPWFFGGSLALITVWSQVRVLAGPPAFAREASEGCRAGARRAKADRFPRATARQASVRCLAAKRAKAAAPKPAGRRRATAHADTAKDEQFVSGKAARPATKFRDEYFFANPPGILAPPNEVSNRGGF